MAFFRWKCLPRCCCLFENCFELVFRMILHLICHFNPPFWPWSMGQVRVQGTLGKFSDDQLTSLFSSTCFSSLLAFITSDNKFFSWLWEKRGTVKTRFHVLFKATEVSSVYSLSNLWTGPLIPPTVLKLMKQRFPVASKQAKTWSWSRPPVGYLNVIPVFLSEVLNSRHIWQYWLFEWGSHPPCVWWHDLRTSYKAWIKLWK